LNPQKLERLAGISYVPPWVGAHFRSEGLWRTSCSGKRRNKLLSLRASECDGEAQVAPAGTGLIAPLSWCREPGLPHFPSAPFPRLLQCNNGVAENIFTIPLNAHRFCRNFHCPSIHAQPSPVPSGHPSGKDHPSASPSPCCNQT